MKKTTIIILLALVSIPILYLGIQVKEKFDFVSELRDDPDSIHTTDTISTSGAIEITSVGQGWARNSVNTVIFRKNSLITHDGVQYIAYYNADAQLVLGKRKVGARAWFTQVTAYEGHAQDAHNDISVTVDGDGYLHVSWDHHDTPLRYARSVSPGSLELSKEMIMTGSQESKVSYPEFYKLPGGDLLFFYRDGSSGNGSLVMNKYDHKNKTWHRLQDQLIDGEGQRNAYWQACVDASGTIHLSWVWRESPDVASNHDLCYAKSSDGGVTWQTSNGQRYQLPITINTAETVQAIPQNSELINQTSMVANSQGDPFIISYWKPKGSDVPQYQLVYKNRDWKVENLSFRSEPFSLSGMGTKKIPISRPQILVTEDQVFVIFRDAERDNRISVAQNKMPFKDPWTITDLTGSGYDSWEPTLDSEQWHQNHVISLFLQKTDQIDGEGLSDQPASVVEVLDWKVPLD
ncbi:BNR repeat-containing protein [Fulvivirga ligni]|uniref:BNR repeat-containing protein n=1 Tax=Fulvivirga ligni TaxID=2904246 RepID=UPI001F361F2E|nr:BNR repeat-containing protein [Fulvivirga ligni]UII20320.1 BNR repeat-containing protein [Fulvivirga ligni]